MSSAGRAAVLVLLTLAVLFFRRPDQFLHPYVWVEDGPIILRAFAERGLASIAEPVQGYHILVPKIIALTAFKTSILWTPEIQLVLTVAFIAAVVAAVAFSPTHLPWPYPSAIAVLFIPTDAEVFAVSEYTFWWAGLLLILALVWDADRGKAWLRWLYLVIGGLSSPIVVPICALIGLRAVIERRGSEFVAAGIAVAAAAIQLATTYFNAQLKTTPFQLGAFWTAAERFFGFFFVGGNPFDSRRFLLAGLLLGAVLLAAIWISRRKLDRCFALLVLAYILICLITAIRLPVDAIHPVHAGPRYFFYPFIVLAWIILWVAAKSPRPMRIALIGICCWTALLAGRDLSRRHEAVDWRQHVTACAQSERYELPIHFAGTTRFMWSVDLTGEQCRKLISGSLF
jgi:hypothetical protein